MKVAALADKGNGRDIPLLEGADTPMAGGLDDLTSLAGTTCQTPIALLTLMEAEQTRLVSWFGRELKESGTFTDLTVAEGKLLVVSDTLKDKRFKNHPLVTGKSKVRFYAGAPVRRPDGRV